jgi:hypothetical protein
MMDRTEFEAVLILKPTATKMVDPRRIADLVRLHTGKALVPGSAARPHHEHESNRREAAR